MLRRSRAPASACVRRACARSVLLLQTAWNRCWTPSRRSQLVPTTSPAWLTHSDTCTLTHALPPAKLERCLPIVSLQPVELPGHPDGAHDGRLLERDAVCGQRHRGPGHADGGQQHGELGHMRGGGGANGSMVLCSEPRSRLTHRAPQAAGGVSTHRMVTGRTPRPTPPSNHPRHSHPCHRPPWPACTLWCISAWPSSSFSTSSSPWCWVRAGAAVGCVAACYDAAVGASGCFTVVCCAAGPLRPVDEACPARPTPSARTNALIQMPTTSNWRGTAWA